MTNYYWCHLHFHQGQLADRGPSYKWYQRELFICHQITLLLLYLTINMVRDEVKKSLSCDLQQCLPDEVNLPFGFRICLVLFSLILSNRRIFLFVFKIVLDQLFLLPCKRMSHREIVKLFKLLVDFNRFNSGILLGVIKIILLLRIVVPKNKRVLSMNSLQWSVSNGFCQSSSLSLTVFNKNAKCLRQVRIRYSGFETQSIRHQKSKTGYRWPHKKDLFPPNSF